MGEERRSEAEKEGESVVLFKLKSREEKQEKQKKRKEKKKERGSED